MMAVVWWWEGEVCGCGIMTRGDNEAEVGLDKNRKMQRSFYSSIFFVLGVLEADKKIRNQAGVMQIESEVFECLF